MEKTLTAPSKRQCADSLPTLESLISEWVAKLAVNAGASLDAKTQAVYCSIWLEGLSDLSPAVLLAAFRKTLRECPYWPVKVADIRKHVAHAVSNATDEAAEQAWERVLEIRRVHYNPDLPGYLAWALAKLPERIRQAARAAGVFREHESVEALHVWAKKVFIESFLRWDESADSLALLPEGDIKNLLTGVAEAKALPAPPVDFHALHTRGLEYCASLKQSPPELSSEARLLAADQLAEAARQVLEQPREHVIVVTDEGRAALHRQAEMLKRSFPMRPEAFLKNPQLRQVYERFGLEIPEPTQSERQGAQ